MHAETSTVAQSLAVILSVSKMTEQLLTCGRLMGVKLHAHADTHARGHTANHITLTHWVGMGTGDLWESGRVWNFCMFKGIFVHMYVCIRASMCMREYRAVVEILLCLFVCLGGKV